MNNQFNMPKDWIKKYSNQKKNTTQAQKTQAIVNKVLTNAAKKQVQMSNKVTSGYINRFSGIGGNELKFKDTFTNNSQTVLIKTGSSVFFDSSTAISPFSFIPRGTGPNDRIGNKIVGKQLNFRATVDMGTSQIPNNVWTGAYKLYVVLDTQCNGTIPNTQDIWQTNDLGVVNINSMMNISNSMRFRILKKMKGRVQCNSTTYWNGTSAVTLREGSLNILEFSLKLDDIPISYATSNTNGAPTGITQNNIWLYIFSDEVSTGEMYIVDPTARVRFSDN